MLRLDGVKRKRKGGVAPTAVPEAAALAPGQVQGPGKICYVTSHACIVKSLNITDFHRLKKVVNIGQVKIGS